LDAPSLATFCLLERTAPNQPTTCEVAENNGVCVSYTQYSNGYSGTCANLAPSVCTVESYDWGYFYNCVVSDGGGGKGLCVDHQWDYTGTNNYLLCV